MQNPKEHPYRYTAKYLLQVPCSIDNFALIHFELFPPYNHI